ncbi:MAG: asparaginase domain-containing protein, partial [Paracoccus sp. (in: a-proteobacteria)]
MRICVINTGGTISCVGRPLAPMPAARFAQAARDLLGGALAAAMPGDRLHFDTGLRFSDQEPGTLDSTDLRPSDWCRIARRVLDLYADHDAFVILHGTDTMDYSGAALPLLLNVFDDLGLARAALSKPVILTGAQLPLFAETPEGMVLNAGSDGLANLTGALASARLRLPEVALFFDGRLMR